MTIMLDTIELPDDLAWPDRYSWQSVETSAEFSLTGAALFQSSEKTTGRPITLQSGENRAWLTHAEVAAVKALQAVAGEKYTLSVRGETFTVTIQSVDARPLFDVADDSDHCAITIKMLTAA